MKMMTGMCVLASTAVGMAAGAYLATNCMKVRKVCKSGTRAMRMMLNRL